MFGKVRGSAAAESTPFYPRSPYGVAKVYGHWITINYRESYNLFACCGILFNHESPRRGLEFVTRKITHAVARIKLGMQKRVARWATWKRDATGDSPATTCARMWLMLQQDKPDDYVVATGETHSVREFVRSGVCARRPRLAGSCGAGPDVSTGPAEVDLLIGDPSKAGRMLGWEPESPFQDLVEMMVDADMEDLQG